MFRAPARAPCRTAGHLRRTSGGYGGADPAAGTGNGNTVTAKAEVVETLGPEIFVYLTCGAHSLVARMEVPECPLTVGQTLEVDLKMSKAHIFDKETSRTIV